MNTVALNCPRCQLPLTHFRLGGVNTDICEHCGGVWLDRLELARFLDPSDPFGEALVVHLGQVPTPLIDHSQRVRCPRDPDVVMLRRPISAAKPTPIDECPSCGGHWLDAWELAELRR